MNEFRAFFHIRRNKWKVRLKLRITFPRRSDRVVEEDFSGLTSVADKVNQAQRDQRTFFDIEPQTITRFDGVTHTHLGVAMFAIEQLEKKRRIISPRRR